MSGDFLGLASALSYTHSNGQRCWRTERGHWVRDGAGIGPEAECPDAWHGEPDQEDPVNHPAHYKWLPVEAIEITERFGFVLGNCLKYILRADHKGKPLEDLRKARWYLDREIANREKGL